LPFLVLALGLYGCRTPLQKSVHLDRDIVVDGDVSDWPTVTGKEADQKVLVRTFHDEGFLYVSIVVRDAGYARTILAGGLKTWFDMTGGDHKTMGIVFPVGMGALDYKVKDVDRKLRDPEALVDLVKVMTESIWSVDAKGAVERWTTDGLRAEGFEAQATFPNGGFACEMKIPIETTRTKVVSLVPDGEHILGLGLEATGLSVEPPPDAESRSKPGDGSPEAGASSIGGMRPHGGMGRHGGDVRGESHGNGRTKAIAGFSRLKSWTKISLSPTP
jgi:hypothetical protein